MKITLEMQEEKDYEKTNIKEKELKKIFENKIRSLLKLRKEDKVKIILK